MSEQSSYRRERIERLLSEVKYEIERGVVDREIDESLGFEFIVPISRLGDGWVVQFRLSMQPVSRQSVDLGSRLRLVEKDG